EAKRINARAAVSPGVLLLPLYARQCLFQLDAQRAELSKAFNAQRNRAVGVVNCFHSPLSSLLLWQIEQLAPQQLPQRARRPFERFAELLRILAAGLREIGLATALATHDRGELADQGAGGDAVDEVLRHRGQQRNLAVGDAAEDHHAGLELRAQRVGEIAEVAAADVVGAARDQLHAVDFDGAVFLARRTAGCRFHAQLPDLLLVLLLLFLGLAGLLRGGGFALAEVLERAAAGERLHATTSSSQ